MSYHSIIGNFMISLLRMTSFCYLVVGGLVSLLSGGASLAGNVSSMADLQKHVHEVASRVTAATVALVSDGGETLSLIPL